MFLIGFRLSKKKTVVLTLALLVIFFLSLYVGYSQEYKTTENSYFCNNTDDIAMYLSSFNIDFGEFQIDEITVPYEFSDVYSSYNLIQKEQGFDLTEYKGKTLTRYTANVKNYPDFDDDVYVEVLVYDKLIVGADIYSVASNGFIVALK